MSMNSAAARQHKPQAEPVIREARRGDWERIAELTVTA